MTAASTRYSCHCAEQAHFVQPNSGQRQCKVEQDGIGWQSDICSKLWSAVQQVKLTVRAGAHGGPQAPPPRGGLGCQLGHPALPALLRAVRHLHHQRGPPGAAPGGPRAPPPPARAAAARPTSRGATRAGLRDLIQCRPWPRCDLAFCHTKVSASPCPLSCLCRRPRPTHAALVRWGGGMGLFGMLGSV